MTRSRRRQILVVGPLLAAALGSSLTAPIASAQILTPVQGFTVVDADGLEVGPTIDAAGAVAFDVDGRWFVLRVLSDRLEGSLLFFESTNCSGTPFLEARFSRPVIPPVAVTLPGSTVYLDDPEAAPRTITARSQLSRACETIGFKPTINAIPAVPVIDLDPLFRPPFRLVPRL